MNRNLLLLASFSALLLPSCASSKHTHAGPTGTFINTPVTIDGDDAEWPSPYPYYDSKAKISYAIANDGSNLYLTIKASDQQIQRKIMRGGLKTWIDTSGRKEEVTMINYPIKQNGRPDMPDEARGRKSNEDGRPPMRDSNARKRPPMVFSLDLSLAGFAEGNGNFTISKSNPNDVLIRMNTNAYDELVWEAAIPLKSLYPAASAHLLAGKSLSICFEIGGMAMPARDVTHPHRDHEGEGGGGMSGGGGRGGMGGGGGGMGHDGPGGHGGGPGGENGDQELLSQTTRTWVKTSIAAH